jgi:AcrR family transcriptional regulator
MPAVLDSQTSSQKDRLLAAALEVFSRQGFKGANVRDIAELAGCNHAVIRYYFESKDNLWREAVRFLFDRMAQKMTIDDDLRAKLLAGDREAYVAWLRRYIRYCAQHPDHARIMVQTSIHDGEQLCWATEHFIKQQHESVELITQALVKNGVLPAHNTVFLIYIVSAACQALFTLAPEAREIHGITIDEETVDAYCETVIDVLLRR